MQAPRSFELNGKRHWDVSLHHRVAYAVWSFNGPATTADIVARARDQNGVFGKSRYVETCLVGQYLRKLLGDGVVVKLSHGVYAHKDFSVDIFS